MLRLLLSSYPVIPHGLELPNNLAEKQSPCGSYVYDLDPDPFCIQYNSSGVTTIIADAKWSTRMCYLCDNEATGVYRIC